MGAATVHSLVPPLHVNAHAPREHTCSDPHRTPQAPQFAGSVSSTAHRSAPAAPHKLSPAVHPGTHAPFWHPSVAPHAWPQAPQLARSRDTSAHLPLQRARGVGQPAPPSAVRPPPPSGPTTTARPRHPASATNITTTAPSGRRHISSASRIMEQETNSFRGDPDHQFGITAHGSMVSNLSTASCAEHQVHWLHCSHVVRRGWLAGGRSGSSGPIAPDRVHSPPRSCAHPLHLERIGPPIAPS